LLAACSQAPEPVAPAVQPPVTGQEAPPPVAMPADEIDFKATSLRSPLPEGIEFPFPYHRLNDNTAKAGTAPQRRVYVEIRQVSPPEAEAAFTERMVQHGFFAPQVNVVRGVREL